MRRLSDWGSRTDMKLALVLSVGSSESSVTWPDLVDNKEKCTVRFSTTAR